MCTFATNNPLDLWKAVWPNRAKPENQDIFSNGLDS